VLPTNSALSLLWWGVYTILGIWAQRTAPGIDFFAPGFIVSLQEQSPQRTVLLAVLWILLAEGAGNLPFGYGLAQFGLLTAAYFMGRSLFEARSYLFMALLGLWTGAIHPILIYSVSSLANLQVDMRPVLVQGAVQMAIFPVIWFLTDHFFPERLRQDVRPL
jgi:FtsH-binding integral membrane protein